MIYTGPTIYKSGLSKEDLDNELKKFYDWENITSKLGHLSSGVSGELYIELNRKCGLLNMYGYIIFSSSRSSTSHQDIFDFNTDIPGKPFVDEFVCRVRNNSKCGLISVVPYSSEVSFKIYFNKTSESYSFNYLDGLKSIIPLNKNYIESFYNYLDA